MNSRFPLASIILDSIQRTFSPPDSTFDDFKASSPVNNAMSEYRGTLLFTSHDQQLVNTVANRIIEITPKGTIDKMMSYNDYLKDDKIIALREQMYA